MDTAERQFDKWKNLEVELLVKFMDGNVLPQEKDGSFTHSKYNKGMPEKVEQPGYTELWKETVAREHGMTIRAPQQ